MDFQSPKINVCFILCKNKCLLLMLLSLVLCMAARADSTVSEERSKMGGMALPWLRPRHRWEGTGVHAALWMMTQFAGLLRARNGPCSAAQVGGQGAAWGPKDIQREVSYGRWREGGLVLTSWETGWGTCMTNWRAIAWKLRRIQLGCLWNRCSHQWCCWNWKVSFTGCPAHQLSTTRARRRAHGYQWRPSLLQYPSSILSDTVPAIKGGVFQHHGQTRKGGRGDERQEINSWHSSCQPHKPVIFLLTLRYYVPCLARIFSSYIQIYLPLISVGMLCHSHS